MLTTLVRRLAPLQKRVWIGLCAGFGLAMLLSACDVYDPELLPGEGARDAGVDRPHPRDGAAPACAVLSGDCNGDAGGCGVDCAIANAIATCVTGVCKVVTCAPGWEDCDLDGANCETQLGTVENCSGCGMKCDLPNALARCGGGPGDYHCAIAGCEPPHQQDCDGLAANGCEVDERSDARNCGQCGNDCGAHAQVAGAGCSRSACSYTCAPDFGNCNGTTGCETPLTTNSDCGACGVSCATSCATGTCAVNLGWQRRITLNGAEVLGALANFQVVIRLTDSDVQSRAANDGSDIYFVAADETTLLDHEIERYDSVTGALVAWVRLPSLPFATDTVLYLRYGDGGADRSNPSFVWGTNFKSVWHLAQDPGPGGVGGIKDSTSTAHATAFANMDSADSVSGVLGRGIDFDGVDDELSFTNSFTGGGDHTISAWVHQRATDNADTVISFGTDVMNRGRFLYAAQEASSTLMPGFFGNELDSGVSIEGAGWKHVVWTWSASTTNLYVDGVLRHGPVLQMGANTFGTLGRIGNAYWTTRNLHGQLDEVRVAIVARSASWIQTEYNNQRPSSTFIKTVGASQLVTQ